MLRLQREFRNRLIERVERDNAFPMLILADKIGFSQLREKIIDFIRSTWNSYVKIKILEQFKPPIELYVEIVKGLNSTTPKEDFWDSDD